ncbi:LCP family protein [Lactobacillus kefiranofaciens]|uniref:LCP family glycopolymer transferase n=1 Tax=Lactobacillus kefiranofaciens TaxID=267818 RepID=UPI000BA6DE09|nr:LCP family protein [Lactobacillus kefiranofaciens]MCJ2172495.1 LCP family protein [Lactobacillus kefiranofaciens]PAK97886.1 LytR family transcriptional regulator [Lactobacillus kefiranofaciens]QNT44384.1 LCP family protein [Lactobacillus kefiranofaciens]
MRSRREEREAHPSATRVQNHQYKNHHVWAWVTGVIALIAVIAVAGYFASIYFKTKKAVDQTYDPHNAVKTTGEFNGKKRFAVLLMGTDTGALKRTEKRGRTDTMILAVVNPAKKHYTLVSIPRDTMAQMIGETPTRIEKINAAYELGGAKMSMASVSELINVPIKYYAVVNMGGIMKMIRYVGGINIRPTLSFEYGGYVFKKGKLMHMGGATALAYSRMRYDDPRGDYGRQERQRQVIITLIKKAVSVSSLSNLDSILTSVSSNVRTNLPFSALQQIAMNYRGCADHSSSDYLHGYNAMIKDAAYQVQPTSELQRISNLVRTELDLPEAKVDNNETYQNKRNEANGFSFKSSKTQKYHIYDYTEAGDN